MSLASTFVQALRSVGDAMTLAAAGVYLKKRDMISAQGTKTLAVISAQVTIPALLFSKLLACNQDWSADACPSVKDSLKDGWVMMLWPCYVTLSGLLVGWLLCLLVRTDPSKRAAVMACIAFGNSTGLPITLLAVIHNSYSKTTELGAVDPIIYLSIYLLMYPVFQWTIGGWLLAPPAAADASSPDASLTTEHDRASRRSVSKEHVLARYSESSLSRASMGSLSSAGRRSEREQALREQALRSPLDSAASLGSDVEKEGDVKIDVLATLGAIAKQAAQPPVIAAFIGIIFAVTPVRQILVDVNDRDGDAPLEWFFEGISSIGDAAVPINSKW
jgi:predicted permease